MSNWQYHPASDFGLPWLQRLRRFPREPNMLWCAIRSLVALVLRGWLRIYHRLRIAGRENLPADGSFVLVANHSSHLDTLCLLAALPLAKLHRTFPAAAADYFFVSVPRMAIGLGRPRYTRSQTVISTNSCGPPPRGVISRTVSSSRSRRKSSFR